MERVQLALNVSDVDAAVDFYSKLFDAVPAKRRPGYANFAIERPPLKLVLIENADATETLNHLGIEVSTREAVGAATQRLDRHGLKVSERSQVDCCYALQDKAWVHDPDGAPWEVYTVLGDSEQRADDSCCTTTVSACC